ncbi:SRPBCC family protein [Falsirhodobacter algicola]|uniref:Polyketide cyclase / dehydrase and lipid transport n=1 Tax=Falsirhodobacter algicola TaxID=2692330 RepID=A0A8J8MQI3_9RHOB|nr:SRPBCC family protein [Falsirhodobacter algicola]QUS34832.1 hypothetical protein GR316_00245 [Falsirhodobacter algicola]
MKIISKAEIEAPAPFVFERMTDFDMWERKIRNRDVVLQRQPGPVQTGTTWQTRIPIRGRKRDMAVTLTEMTPDTVLRFRALDAALQIDSDFELTSLSENRTLLTSRIEIKPLNIAARLLVQSLRLARGKVEQRIQQRTREFARQTGQDWRKLRDGK